MGSFQPEASTGWQLRPKGPLLVYLDLNKWVDLAHAEVGTNKAAQFEHTLALADEMVTKGHVVFPLSSAHFIEVAKIGSDDRRRTLARLMTRLSRGWFLPAADYLITTELRRAIAIHLGKPVDAAGGITLTRSLKAVFVDPKKIDALGGFNEALFQSPLVLEELLATARVDAQFINRWQTFADQHEAGRALRWENSKDVRKRAYCALVTIGIQDRLIAVLAEFGLTMDVLKTLGPDGCVSLLESAPLLDVEINLHVERNEQRDRDIQANDEIDLGFLSLAIPYSHAVVTEKFWTSLVSRQKLDQKYGTLVGSDINEVLASVNRRIHGSPSETA